MDESSTRTVRRLTGTVFVSVAAGMIGLFAAFTTAPLVAVELTGSRTWSGLPASIAILGTAAGTATLASLMARRGRRPGLVVGWLVGALGAVVAIGGVVQRSFLLVLVGVLALGVGHASNQLGRYAAVDPHPPQRRGSVLSLVVWAGAVGGVLGPALLEPGAALAEAINLDRLAGGFLIALITFALAATLSLAALRPDPSRLRVAEDTGGPLPTARSLTSQMRTGILVLITAQFVMVLIMTVTPVHVRGHDHSLGDVGIVMSAHVLGMYALSPLFGRLTDRVGAMRVVLFGLATVAASAILGATAPGASIGALSLALLLLGLGWSAAFVASSTMLTGCSPVLQGRIDALGWSLAAAASIGAGVLLEWVGYAAVSLVGLAVTLAVACVVALNLLRRPAAGTPAEEPAIP